MTTASPRVYVGTIGEGLWRSVDGGETFARTSSGMFLECHDARALVVDPRNPRTLYLGSEQGLFRTTDGADSWSRVASPLDGLQIWSILLLPSHPDTILVGMCPSRIFRSGDGGATWSEANVRIRQDCPGIMATRVTSFCAHPGSPDLVWAGVEIDGVYLSRDGGCSFGPIGTGLSSPDIHALAYVPAGGRLLASTNNDVNVSLDDGATWQPLQLRDKLPLPYFRNLAQRGDRPGELLLGNGDSPPGSTGLVARSLDGGATWQPTRMPARSNSTMWNFAVNPANPDLAFASSVSGQLYRSTDGGAIWQKLPREFGEIRAPAWTP